MIDHDAIFKQLLNEFFLEFLALFCPTVLPLIDTTRLTFVDKELFAEIIDPDRREADLIARVGQAGQDAFFIVHVEHQAQEDKVLNRRMFRYFSRLHDRYDVPIYPIALCSYPTPQTPIHDAYQVALADLDVLHFQYRTVQLNQLDWRQYLQHPNPVALALLTRMRIPRNERVRVKAACLAHLIGLKLTPRRQQILGAFLGIYLKLSPTDEAQVVQELAQAYPYQQEEAMELLTQWHIAGMEEGREEGLALGLAQGREEGQHAAALLIVQRLLSKRFGPLPTTTSERLIGLPTERLEVLAADLLDFTSVADLAAWLDSYGPSPDVVA